MTFCRSSGARARFLTATLAGLVAMGVVSACSSTTDAGSAQTGSDSQATVAEAEGDPVDGGNLAVGVTVDTTGWNPTVDQWGVSSAFVASSMFETLTMLDAEARPQPWLATDWKANDDFTQWTITLRDDVTFHNGEKLDAGAVKANIDDTTASPLTGVSLGGIFKEVKVIDDTHVEVDLNQSWAAFPGAYLGGPNGWMRAPAMLTDPASSKNPIGTGAFKFASWDPGGTLKVVKNDDYWRDGQPHLEQIEFTPIVDDVSRGSSLQSGDIDLMLTTNANDANELEGEFNVVRDWDSEDMMLTVNTRESAGGDHNPMANQHARLALSYATNPTQIAEQVGENLEIPTSPFSTASPWADPSIADNYAGYDPEKAKAELEQYKQETGDEKLSIVLTGPADTNISAQLQALAQQWSDVGIETQIESVEQTAMALQGVVGNFEVLYGGIYSAPEPDLNYIFWSESTTRPDGEIGINFTGYATDETQAALDRSRSTDDRDQRKAAYADLLKLLNEQSTNIHLFFTPYSIVATDRVHGLQSAAEIPFGNFMPNTIWAQAWLADS